MQAEQGALSDEAGLDGRTADDNEVHAHDKEGQQQWQQQPQRHAGRARAAHQADVQARPRYVTHTAPAQLRLRTAPVALHRMS